MSIFWPLNMHVVDFGTCASYPATANDIAIQRRDYLDGTYSGLSLHLHVAKLDTRITHSVAPRADASESTEPDLNQ